MYKRNKTIIAVAIGLISFSALFFLFSIVKFIHATDNAPDDMVHYTSSQHGIEFDYPKNWYVTDVPHGNHGDLEAKLIITYFTQSPYIVFSSSEFDNPTYNDIVCWGISETTMQRKVLAITDTMGICTKDLEKFEYYDLRENIFGRTAFRCVDYFTKNVNEGYIFTFCSKDDEWESLVNTFNEIHDSIIIR